MYDHQCREVGLGGYCTLFRILIYSAFYFKVIQLHCTYRIEQKNAAEIADFVSRIGSRRRSSQECVHTNGRNCRAGGKVVLWTFLD